MIENNQKYEIAVLGGDRRQANMINEFLARGFGVRAYGLGGHYTKCNGAEIFSSIDKAMDGADAVILPLPVTRDNLYLSADGEKVSLSDIVKLTAKNRAFLLGGMLPQEMIRQCEALGVEACDYYKSEALQKKNALPSAEGALMIAMEHTDITVKGMKALVTGFGRIGALLADMLDKLGADVTVGARRDEVLCELSLLGYRAVRIGGDGTELGEAVKNSDVIFNTVPSVIFNEKVLSEVRNKPLYVEIASSPGGIDLGAARKIGIEIVFAPSLPGKYSPVNAGRYIFETISEMLSERRKI